MGNAAAHDAVGEFAARRDAQPPLVQISAAALLGDVELVAHRIVNNARFRNAVLHQRDRDREQRNSVHEVGGAVERIDHPLVRRIAARHPAALLHQESELRPCSRQFPMQDFFRAPVGGGDEISRPLDRDLEILQLAEIADQRARRFARGGDHDGDERRAEHGILFPSPLVGEGGRGRKPEAG